MKKIIILLSLFASIQASEAKDIGTSLYALRSGLLTNILAKELCSCVFVTGASIRLGKDEALKRCIGRANLPLSEKLMKKLVKLIVVTPGTVEIKPRALSEIATLGKIKKATAVYDAVNPQNGCSLKF